MRLKKGDVLRKRRGGQKRCEVVRVLAAWVVLKPLAKSATSQRSGVTSLVLPLGEDGLPEGYEVAT